MITTLRHLKLWRRKSSASNSQSAKPLPPNSSAGVGGASADRLQPLPGAAVPAAAAAVVGGVGGNGDGSMFRSPSSDSGYSDVPTSSSSAAGSRTTRRRRGVVDVPAPVVPPPALFSDSAPRSPTPPLPPPPPPHVESQSQSQTDFNGTQQETDLRPNVIVLVGGESGADVRGYSSAVIPNGGVCANSCRRPGAPPRPSRQMNTAPVNDDHL